MPKISLLFCVFLLQNVLCNTAYLQHSALIDDRQLLFNTPSVVLELPAIDTTEHLSYALFLTTHNILNNTHSAVSQQTFTQQATITLNNHIKAYTTQKYLQSQIRYFNKGSDSIEVDHANHEVLMGSYILPTENAVFQIEGTTRNTYTLGAGYTPYLFIRYSHGKTIQQDSLLLWTKEFKTNGYNAINALYQTSKERACVNLITEFKHHHLALTYFEEQIKPNMPDISRSPSTQTHYWIADSTRITGYSANYSLRIPYRNASLKAGYARTTSQSTTGGYWLNTEEPPYFLNIKKYHYSAFQANINTVSLSVNALFANHYTPTLGVGYTRYAIATNPTDSTVRSQDFIRYDQLFRPTTSIIILSSYLRQSDFLAFDLHLSTLTLSISHAVSFHSFSLEIAHPINIYTLSGSIHRMNYTIPTGFFQPPILNIDQLLDPTGTAVTIPLSCRLSLPFKPITVSISATQIIPVVSNFKWGPTADSEISASPDTKQEPFKNGFSFTAGFSINL